MSVEETEPPQYIVTAPGEENNDDDDDKSSTTTTTSTATAKSTATAVNVKTNKSPNTRSQSLQSSSTATIASASATTTTTTGDHHLTSTASTLMQQLKAQSSINIVTEKHVQKFSSSQTTATSSSSSTSTSGVKSKFTSFLQHPDTSVSSHGATFLTAQQKHVRQFVRSTSAHSSTDSAGASGISISGKAEKCIRSSSQQIDDDHHSFTTDYSKGLQQSAAILISKSAETIEGIRSCSSTSGSMRTQLTLSGGFLAPPNRKLTILSPIHAPPGLHELLKKHRSPLSPRISFPGTDSTELFP